jgi:hypothetical protein
MRLWVPYDTVSSWDRSAAHDAGACGSSVYYNGPPARFNGVNGAILFRQLVWNIQGVEALGLTPEVVFSAGSGEGAPSFPDPGYGDARSLFAGLTTAGLDYSCGVVGVIAELRQALGSSAPIHWEAFNEPDARGAYLGALQNGCKVHSSCGAAARGVDYNHRGYLCGRKYAYCGPLEAAELWQLAQAAVSSQHWSDEQVAALSMIDPESAFGIAYIQSLGSLYACAAGVTAPGAGRCATAGRFPRYWAVHDYDDPTAGGTADLRTFENRLSELTRQTRQTRAAVGPLQVWVTESGVELSSLTRADLNRAGCSAPHAPDNGTIGACVNNDPANQARGARAWRALLGVRAPGVQTTQVYWFEFELIPGWDSALVDASGRARASLCALVTGVHCDGNPTDYLMRDG